VEFALSELSAQATDKLEALRTALREPEVSIKVVSAYPLDEARRAAFTRTLSTLADRGLTLTFREDALLMAGVCVVAGSWVLMANLRDELAFFAGAFDHGG
jgi:F-type H+-transporting ATPase subunit b